MEIDTFILIFLLFSVSIYLLLQSQLTDMILGFALLSNGINLMLLFTSENPDAKSLPIILENNIQAGFVDPLPQALILTAIVIGFGLISYLIVLAFRLFGYFRTQDTRNYIQNVDE
jgi:multisubunit Na+/H+ antiporter MnhC subunit